jgi:hypothetical protein
VLEGVLEGVLELDAVVEPAGAVVVAVSVFGDAPVSDFDVSGFVDSDFEPRLSVL